VFDMEQASQLEVQKAVEVVVQFGASQLRWLGGRGSKRQRQAARLAADHLDKMTVALVERLTSQDPEQSSRKEVVCRKP
jgi:hypothetical protein